LKEARLEAKSAGNAAMSKAEHIAHSSIEAEKREKVKREELEQQVNELTNSLRQAKMARKSEDRKHASELSKLEQDLTIEKEAKLKAEKIHAKLQSELQSTRQQVSRLKEENAAIALEEKAKAELLIKTEVKSLKDDIENKAAAQVSKLELVVANTREEEELKLNSAFRKGELSAMGVSDLKLKHLIENHEEEKMKLVASLAEEKKQLLHMVEVSQQNVEESKKNYEKLLNEKLSMTSKEENERLQYEEKLSSMKAEYEAQCESFAQLKGAKQTCSKNASTHTPSLRHLLCTCLLFDIFTSRCCLNHPSSECDMKTYFA
jgi:hypothetical protein